MGEPTGAGSGVATSAKTTRGVHVMETETQIFPASIEAVAPGTLRKRKSPRALISLGLPVFLGAFRPCLWSADRNRRWDLSI